MRIGGTVAFDAARPPGAMAVALACDLSAAAVEATERFRHVAGTVVRGVAAVLRARGPVVAALVTSFRAMPAPWFVAVGSPHAGGMSYLAQPPRGSATRRRTRSIRPRELVLPADATAPGRARLFLRAATQEWGIGDDLAQDAAMVITELVANAVDHARSESTLSVGVKRGTLCVAVRDARRGRVPRPAPIDPTAPRGRGLQMVDALTSAWGVTLHADGKTVWAVVG
jgi:anti-sigma regulatory factor (Ser/Thr protein kinase)